MAELLQFDEWLLNGSTWGASILCWTTGTDLAKQAPVDTPVPVYFFLRFVEFSTQSRVLDHRSGDLHLPERGDQQPGDQKSVQRPRPCQTEQLKEEIHLAITCGSGYSFPSSHATNHFALAVFVILTSGGASG